MATPETCKVFLSSRTDTADRPAATSPIVSPGDYFIARGICQQARPDSLGVRAWVDTDAPPVTLPDTVNAVLADTPDTIAGFNGSGAGRTYSAGALRDFLTPAPPLTGCVARFSALDLSLADGDPVSTWAPSVGSPGSMAAAGSDRPTYLATGAPSGLAGVYFDGSKYMSIASPAGLPAAAQAGTVVAFVAGCPAGSSDYKHLVQYGTDANDSARGLAYNGNLWSTVDWVSNVAAEATAARTTQATMLEHSYDGANLSIYVQGAEAGTNAVALTTGSDVLTVGRNLSGAYGGQFGTFVLCEYFIYNRVLTNGDRFDLRRYGQATWGTL